MPTLTKRSIIEDKGRFHITIPTAWTNFQGLVKGESLGISMNGDLHLKTNPCPKDKTMKLIYRGGILTVSLPIAWVRAHNLKKGDKVEVIANGELIVRPVKRGEE